MPKPLHASFQSFVPVRSIFQVQLIKVLMIFDKDVHIGSILEKLSKFSYTDACGRFCSIVLRQSVDDRHWFVFAMLMPFKMKKKTLKNEQIIF
jgi:hypothetical protein